MAKCYTKIKGRGTKERVYCIQRHLYNQKNTRNTYQKVYKQCTTLQSAE